MDGETTSTERFDWPEVNRVFSLGNDPEPDEENRDAILERINRWAASYGREYVVKRIALDV